MLCCIIKLLISLYHGRHSGFTPVNDKDSRMGSRIIYTCQLEIRRAVYQRRCLTTRRKRLHPIFTFLLHSYRYIS